MEQIKSLDNVIIGGLDPTTNEILRICRLEHVVGTVRHLMPGKLTPSGSCIGVYCKLNGQLFNYIVKGICIRKA